MTAVVFLIHFHVQPTMTLVHVDTVIHTGLIPHLDHPDVLIGVINLSYIIIRVEITVTFQQIGTTTIGINCTILVIMIGDTNPNSFSPARSYSQDHYLNQHQNRPFQNRYQSGNYRNRPPNNNNNAYDWN